MRMAAAVCLVSALLSGEVYAAFVEGEEAFNRKDFVAAFTLLKPDADAGNAQAQYYLGLMLRKGSGVTKDPAAAVLWLQKAAAQGQWEAVNTLGTMYRLGEGLPQDYQMAMHWYMEAAKLGMENAMYRIALMFQAGQGVRVNPAEAYKWAYTSAKHGGQPEPTRLRDKLAKLLTVNQIQQAQHDGDAFLNDMEAKLAAMSATRMQTANAVAPADLPVWGGAGSHAPNAPTDCLAGKSPVDNLVCLSAELREADREMDQLYQDAVSIFEGSARDNLIKSQQAWKIIRSNVCKIASPDVAMRPPPSSKIKCMFEVYARRTEQLVAIVEGATIPDGESESREKSAHQESTASIAAAADKIGVTSSAASFSNPGTSIANGILKKGSDDGQSLPVNIHAGDEIYQYYVSLKKCSAYVLRLAELTGKETEKKSIPSVTKYLTVADALRLAKGFDDLPKEVLQMGSDAANRDYQSGKYAELKSTITECDKIASTKF